MFLNSAKEKQAMLVNLSNKQENTKYSSYRISQFCIVPVRLICWTFPCLCCADCAHVKKRINANMKSYENLRTDFISENNFNHLRNLFKILKDQTTHNLSSK